MNETQLLGSLLPALPDFLPILQNIREKYGIEEISPGDDSIKELILNEGIDLETIRQDFEDQLRAIPDFLPHEFADFSPHDSMREIPFKFAILFCEIT